MIQVQIYHNGVGKGQMERVLQGNARSFQLECTSILRECPLMPNLM